MVILLDHTPEIKFLRTENRLDGLQGKKGFHSFHADWITMKWEQESRCLEGKRSDYGGFMEQGIFPLV
jgi:hypothetical protein